MKYSSKRKFSYFSCVAILLVIKLGANCDNAPKKRAVFPNDFIRVSCVKTPVLENYSTGSWKVTDQCTWKIIGKTDAISTEVTKECTKTSFEQKGGNDIFESYVEIPERAEGIFCEDAAANGTDKANMLTMEQLDVQDVKVASPLSSYNDDSSPKIILQRFSEDYGVRFGAHDVTNKEVKINGAEVDSLKLICIYSSPVKWENITESRRRILEEMNSRDAMWLLRKSEKLETSWKEYLKFIWNKEQHSQKVETRLSIDKLSYTTSLTIPNITSMTGRTYACRPDSNNNSEIFSSVALVIENPRSVGPDEIQLIEQIMGILNSMAHDNRGHGKEPWAAIGSLSSVILVVFLYHLKTKRDQHQNQSRTLPKPEETEMRTRLQETDLPSEQPSTVQNDQPTAVVIANR